MAPRRAELHRRAAERLLRCWGENAATHATELAEHFERGRDFASAVRLRTRAGEHAARRFAGDEAREHYTRALELAGRLPPEEARPLEVALLGRRAAAHLLQARFDEAAREYEVMLEKARAARLPAAECEALSALCNAHFFEQRLPEMAARAAGSGADGRAPGRPAPARRGALPRRARALRGGPARRRRARRSTRPSQAPATSGALFALQIGLAPARLRPLLAQRVHRSRGQPRRGPDPVGGTRGRLRGLRGAHVRRPVARQPGPHVGGPRRLRARDRAGAAQRRSLLGAAAREPPGLRPPRARGGREGPRLRHARARPRPREPLAMGPRAPPRSNALLNLCVDSVRAGDPEGAAALLATLEAGTARSDWLRWMNELRVEAAAAEHYTARGAFDTALERAGRLSRIATRLRARGYACTAARLRGEAALGRRRDERAAAAGLDTGARRARRLPSPARDLEVAARARPAAAAPGRRGRRADARSRPRRPTSTRSRAASTTRPCARASCASPAVREVLDGRPAAA